MRSIHLCQGLGLHFQKLQFYYCLFQSLTTVSKMSSSHWNYLGYFKRFSGCLSGFRFQLSYFKRWEHVWGHLWIPDMGMGYPSVQVQHPLKPGNYLNIERHSHVNLTLSQPLKHDVLCFFFPISWKINGKMTNFQVANLFSSYCWRSSFNTCCKQLSQHHGPEASVEQQGLF